MNFSFTSYLNQEEETKLSYFQGYKITDFTAYTLALCALSDDKQASDSNTAKGEMLEMIKHIHLYHQDWLKGSKASISKLLELVSEQVHLKYPHKVPPFALFNAKENGTIYVLRNTGSFRLWLLRGKKLYCLDQTSRWTRFLLGYRSVFSMQNDHCLLAHSWPAKKHDLLFLQEESRPYPKKKKSWRKLYRLLSNPDQQKLLSHHIIAHLSST